MKFGTYGDIGRKTCQGLAGFKDHFEQDANTLAEWKVDYIKVDGCNEKLEEFFFFPISILNCDQWTEKLKGNGR